MMYYLLNISRVHWPLQLSFMLLLSQLSLAQSTTQLDLKTALHRSESNNAQLLLYPYQQQQAVALTQQAQLRPTPELSLEVENIVGNGDYQTFDSAEITLSLSQNIELGGKQHKRTAYAYASGELEQAEFTLSRLDILAETSRRYYQGLKMQALETVLTDQIKQQQKALTLISQRAQSAAVNQAAVAKIDLRLAQSQALFDALKLEKRLSYRRLAAMWQDNVDFDSLAGNFKLMLNVPDEETVLAAWQNSPVFMQQQAALRLADANVHLAQSQGRSNINLGLGLRHFQASDSQAVNLSISVPLAFKNPNRGRIKAAQAMQRKSQLQLQQQQNLLTLQLLDLQVQMQGLQQQIQTIKISLLPKAHRLVQETESGLKRGHFSVLEWLDAQTELVALQKEQIEKTHLMYLQLLELERITGQALLAPNRRSPSVDAMENKDV